MVLQQFAHNLSSALVAFMLAVGLQSTPVSYTAPQTTPIQPPAAQSTTITSSTTTNVRKDKKTIKNIAKIVTLKRPLPVHTPSITTSTTSLSISSTTKAIVVRPESLYAEPTIPFDTINTTTRAALVNIFCIPETAGVSAISASGVIIDSRGVVLTNAHVGQYFLLEQARANINCVIRTGSPATSHYRAEVLFMSPQWVHDHALDITAAHAMSTGENDYALLLITGTTDGSSLPTTFPSVTPDTRESIAFPGDPILIASYPAGFTKSLTTIWDLSAASTVTTVQRLMTFQTGTVDVLGLGGSVVAQSGSSGGAVVNAWGRLIGIVVTSSDAETTAGRDLHAITMAHVDRSLESAIYMNLEEYLAGDIVERASTFTHDTAPALENELMVAAKII